MNTVNLKINNIPVVAPEGATILEAAHLVGIRIPTLCYLKEINAIGACRICACGMQKCFASFRFRCHHRSKAPEQRGFLSYTALPAGCPASRQCL